jgi:hypothetical protein
MNTVSKTLKFSLALFLCTFGLTVLISSAAHASGAAYTCTWTAGSGGGNANFSDAANWSGCNSAAPQPNDDDNLIFNTSTPLYNSPNNDITNLTLNNIQFMGSSSSFAYSLTGNPITLTGGVTDNTSSGNTGITNVLTIAGNQTFTSAGGTNYTSLKGSGNISAIGPDQIVINDLSNYSGTISSMNAGIELQSYGSFNSNGTVAVSGNAAVTLNNENARSEPVSFNLNLSLGGNGISKIGALNLVGGGGDAVTTLAGPTKLTSNVQVTSSDGNTAVLDIAGSLTTGFTITSAGADVVTIENNSPGQPAVPAVSVPNLQIAYVDSAGDVYIKSGNLQAPYLEVWNSSDPAASVQVSPDRIAILDTSGNLYVNQFPITTTWTKEWTGVSAGNYQVADNSIVVLSNGVLYDKPRSLNNGWGSILSSAVSFKMAQNGNIVAKLSDNTLYEAYGGYGATWMPIATNFGSYAISNNDVAAIFGNELYIMIGGPINNQWHPSLASASSVQLSADGNIGATDTSGNFDVAFGGYGSLWTAPVAANYTAATLSDKQVSVSYGSVLYTKLGTTAGAWTPVTNDAASFGVN